MAVLAPLLSSVLALAPQPAHPGINILEDMVWRSDCIVVGRVERVVEIPNSVQQPAFVNTLQNLKPPVIRLGEVEVLEVPPHAPLGCKPGERLCVFGTNVGTCDSVRLVEGETALFFLAVRAGEFGGSRDFQATYSAILADRPLYSMLGDRGMLQKRIEDREAFECTAFVLPPFIAPDSPAAAQYPADKWPGVTTNRLPSLVPKDLLFARIEEIGKHLDETWITVESPSNSAGSGWTLSVNRMGLGAWRTGSDGVQHAIRISKQELIRTERDHSWLTQGDSPLERLGDASGGVRTFNLATSKGSVRIELGTIDAPRALGPQDREELRGLLGLWSLLEEQVDGPRLARWEAVDEQLLRTLGR